MNNKAEIKIEQFEHAGSQGSKTIRTFSEDGESVVLVPFKEYEEMHNKIVEFEKKINAIPDEEENKFALGEAIGWTYKSVCEMLDNGENPRDGPLAKVLCLAEKYRTRIDEPERKFVPTEPGQYWYRDYKKSEWKIVLVKTDLEVWIGYAQENVSVQRMNGEWWPERISMPGEE